MQLTLSLRMRPHLKKYLTAKFGENYKLSKTDWFGVLVSSVLQRKTNRDFHDPKDHDGKATAVYTVSFSINYADKHGYTIFKRDEINIQRALESHFRDDLYSQALINMSAYGLEFKTTIMHILDAYDIDEDDINYDSLRKDFNRKKKSLAENLLV